MLVLEMVLLSCSIEGNELAYVPSVFYCQFGEKFLTYANWYKLNMMILNKGRRQSGHTVL